MEWRALRKSELTDIISSWTSLEQVKPDPPKEYVVYRREINELFCDVKRKLNIDEIKGNAYQFDVNFALQLYMYTIQKMEISESEAADDSFWIFLGVKVVPDIVFWRWGPGNNDRFFANPRRIYLKVLWWYIHLSWQGDESTTYEVLKQNTTDEIVQLVERSGSYGYRVKLCREIMKKYGQIPTEIKGRGNNLFRKAMKLNTARLAVIEPALYEGEEEGYVNDLFSKLVTST